MMIRTVLALLLAVITACGTIDPGQAVVDGYCATPEVIRQRVRDGACDTAAEIEGPGADLLTRYCDLPGWVKQAVRDRVAATACEDDE